VYFHAALQVYKIINKISLPYYNLHDAFSFAVDFIGHSGRNLHNYLFPCRDKVNYGKQSLTYRDRDRDTAIWKTLSSARYGAKTLKEFMNPVL